MSIKITKWGKVLLPTIILPIIIMFINIELTKPRGELFYTVDLNKSSIYKNTFTGRCSKQIFDTEIKLTLNGNTPIAPGDFEGDFHIFLVEAIEVLRVVIIDNNSHINIEHKIYDNTIKLQPFLMNPKDSFSLRIVTCGKVYSENIRARIKGITRISGREQVFFDSDKGVIAYFGIHTLIYTSIIIGLLILNWKSLEIPTKMLVATIIISIISHRVNILMRIYIEYGNLFYPLGAMIIAEGISRIFTIPFSRLIKKHK